MLNDSYQHLPGGPSTQSSGFQWQFILFFFMRCVRLVGKVTFWMGTSIVQSNWMSSRWQRTGSSLPLSSQQDWACECLLTCIWDVCPVPLPSALKLKLDYDCVSDNFTQHSLSHFKGSRSGWQGGKLKLSLVLRSTPDSDQNNNAKSQDWDGCLSRRGRICYRMASTPGNTHVLLNRWQITQA